MEDLAGRPPADPGPRRSEGGSRWPGPPAEPLPARRASRPSRPSCTSPAVLMSRLERGPTASRLPRIGFAAGRAAFNTTPFPTTCQTNMNVTMIVPDSIDTMPGGDSHQPEPPFDLNRNLPLHYDESVAQRNPDFAGLIRELVGPRITAKGVSMDKAHEREDAKTYLSTKKQEYFQCLAVFTEVQDVLGEWEKVGNSHDAGLASKAQSLFELAHASQFTNVSPDNCSLEDRLQLFGLDFDALVEGLLGKAELKQGVILTRQHVLPEVEERIRKKCERVTEFFEPGNRDEATDFTFAKSTKLADVIQQLSAGLEYDGTKLQQLREQSEIEVTEHYRILAQMVETLAELLTDHKLSKHFRLAEVETDWIRTRYKTMAMKLSVLKSQFLRDTYTKRTVAALRVIRSNLDNVNDELNIELEEAKRKLVEYQSIGSSFEALAKEYAQLLKEINHKEWTLKELQREE